MSREFTTQELTDLLNDIHHMGKLNLQATLEAVVKSALKDKAARKAAEEKLHEAQTLVARRALEAVEERQQREQKAREVEDARRTPLNKIDGVMHATRMISGEPDPSNGGYDHPDRVEARISTHATSE